MDIIRNRILLSAGIFSVSAVCISSWLISKHLNYFTQSRIQSKIIGIIWMVPIYSVDSFLSLWIPSIAIYVDMLRDCYESYVLYLFLSLMLGYLDCEDDDYALITYLETKNRYQNPFPLNILCSKEIPKGRAFLRYCKFGVLQYCVIRPVTTFLAIFLDMMGAYHEYSLNPKYGYFWVLVAINFSVLYAFIVLANFYSTLKEKLYPFEPVGKFLCIKFVIFFAFWQSVVITALVRFGVITDIEGFKADTISKGLQDYLICIEMFLTSIAHLYTFSHIPFTSGYINPHLLNINNDDDNDDIEVRTYSGSRMAIRNNTINKYTTKSARYNNNHNQQSPANVHSSHVGKSKLSYAPIRTVSNNSNSRIEEDDELTSNTHNGSSNNNNNHSNKNKKGKYNSSRGSISELLRQSDSVRQDNTKNISSINTITSPNNNSASSSNSSGSNNNNSGNNVNNNNNTSKKESYSVSNIMGFGLYTKKNNTSKSIGSSDSSTNSSSNHNSLDKLNNNNNVEMMRGHNNDDNDNDQEEIVFNRDMLTYSAPSSSSLSTINNQLTKSILSSNSHYPNSNTIDKKNNNLASSFGSNNSKKTVRFPSIDNNVYNQNLENSMKQAMTSDNNSNPLHNHNYKQPYDVDRDSDDDGTIYRKYMSRNNSNDKTGNSRKPPLASSNNNNINNNNNNRNSNTKSAPIKINNNLSENNSSSNMNKERKIYDNLKNMSTITSSSPSSSILETHFAADSAIRDFNEAMPVMVLPSNFQAAKGQVILSDPASRLKSSKK